MPFSGMHMKWNNLYIPAESKQFLCRKAEADTAGQNQRLKNVNKVRKYQGVTRRKEFHKVSLQMITIKMKIPSMWAPANPNGN